MPATLPEPLEQLLAKAGFSEKARREVEQGFASLTSRHLTALGFAVEEEGKRLWISLTRTPNGTRGRAVLYRLESEVCF